MKRIHFLCLCILLTLITAGCSSSNSTKKTTTGPPAPGTQSGVQVTEPATSPSIDAGQTVSITANQPVLWSLQTATGFGKPPGTLSTSPTTAAGSVVYTAPTAINVPSATQVIVVATSSTDSTQSASIPVFINPALAFNTSSHLTQNTSCTYDPLLGTNDGTVGSTYAFTGQQVGPLMVAGGTAPYTWSIAAGSLPIGLGLASLPPASSSCSTGCGYLFGTPASVGCSQVQLQVTDATGEVATSQTYFVLITPTKLKIQAPDYSDWYQGIPYPPTAFTVSGGTPPYAWAQEPFAALPANLTLTTVTNNTAAAFVSGIPTTAAPNPTVLLVTDSQAPYPAAATLTLNAEAISGILNVPQSPCAPFESGNYNASLMGTYAFLLRGFDANGPVVMAGSFTADGAGNVASGVEDITRAAGSGSQTNVAVTGSYSVFQLESDTNAFRNVGCVTLTGPAGTSTFTFSLGGCSTTSDPTSGECLPNSAGVAGVFSTGRMLEFDNTATRIAGILRLQDTSTFSAGLAGPYAFGFSGWDSVGSRYAAAGSVGSSSGALSSPAADINDGGVVQSALTAGTGSYSIDSTTGVQNGRGTATLTIGSASLDLAFYVVSAREVMLASTGTISTANPIVSGEAISAPGPFTTLSLQNSHMFHTAGVTPTGTDANIGVLSFDGVGDVTGTQYEDEAATLGTTSLSGTYTVNSSSGRVTFFPSQTNPQSLGDHPLVIYAVPVPNTLTRLDCIALSSCVTGFLVSTDQSAQAGLLEFQTPSAGPPPPFSNLYVAGYYFYGTDEILNSATPLIDGASVANPSNASYSGVQNTNYSLNSFYCQEETRCTLLHSNEALSQSSTYSVSTNGTGAVGGESVAVTNGNVIFYIDESPINSDPSITIVEQ